MKVAEIINVLNHDLIHEVFFQDLEENYVDDLKRTIDVNLMKMEVIKIESFSDHDLLITVK